MSAVIVLSLLFLPTGILNTVIWWSLFKTWGRPGRQGALPIAIQTSLLALGIAAMDLGKYGGLIFLFLVALATIVAAPKLIPITRFELSKFDFARTKQIDAVLWLATKPVFGALFSLLLTRELANIQRRLTNNSRETTTSVDDSGEHP